MQENLCPIFQKWLKTLAEFFPIWEGQKAHWGWKKIGPPLEKNVYNRTARYVVHALRPIWKMSEKILNLQNRIYRYLQILFREKATIFYFLCRSCWVARTYLPMKKEQSKWNEDLNLSSS